MNALAELCATQPLLSNATPRAIQIFRLQWATVYTGISLLGWSMLRVPLPCRDGLQANSPSTQRPTRNCICSDQILASNPPLSPGADSKGHGQGFPCCHVHCQPFTSPRRTPEQRAGAGSTPKIVFTLPCPRGRLPEQRVPRCLLLDVLYLTWQWAVPWQYPICFPLSRE